MERTDKTACIIVYYKPNHSLVQKWIDLASSTKKNENIEFIFIDNTPEEELDLQEYGYREKMSNYIPLKSNQGIAKAQNVGITRARELQCDYIVFFDQDSEPKPDLIIGLRNNFINYSKKMKLGAVGPHIVNMASDNKDDLSASVTEISYVDKMISSGTFTSIDVINDAGAMEDTLFIDLVDHEWCWRLQSKGYMLLRINSLQLKHKIGINNIKFMGAHLHLTAPKRYYYTFRNTRRLLFRNYVPTKWKVQAVRHNTVLLLFIPLCKAFKGLKAEILYNAIKGMFSK